MSKLAMLYDYINTKTLLASKMSEIDVIVSEVGLLEGLHNHDWVSDLETKKMLD